MAESKKDLSLDCDPGLPVDWSTQDYAIPLHRLMRREITIQEFSKDPVHTVRAVTSKQIEEFCGSCDYLEESEICKLVGISNQRRYVARNCCGWARVNKTSGVMTEKGFYP